MTLVKSLQDFNSIDDYFPQIQHILSKFFIKRASIKDDRERATDAIIMATSGGDIACRLRHPRYINHKDFTLRYTARGGYESEVQKILRGWARYYLYGFADAGEILRWYLLDVHVIRAGIHREQSANGGRWPFQVRSNGANDSDFTILPFDSFDDGLILGSGDNSRQGDLF